MPETPATRQDRLEPGQKRYVDGEQQPVAFRSKDGTFTLERRGASRFGVFYYSRLWSIRVTRAGATHNIPLGYDLKQAANDALFVKAAFFSGEPLADILARFAPQRLEETQKRVKEEAMGFATLGEIIETYKANAGLLEIRVADNYVQRFYAVIRRALAARNRDMAREAVDELEADILDATIIRDAKKSFDDEAEDEIDLLAKRRSCNSAVTNARALFSKKAIKLHKIYADLRLPDLTEFLEAPLWNESKLKKVYQLPEPAVVHNVMRGLAELKKTDANAYRAALMAAFFGFRAKDIAFARFLWFSAADGKARVTFKRDLGPDGVFDQKGNHVDVVEVYPEVLAELRAMAPNAKPEDYVIEGEKIERQERVQTRLNEWVKAHGVEADKGIHELRKWFGSYLVNEKTAWVAKGALRHQSVETTEQFYAAASMPEELRGYWRKPMGGQ
jgi:hypothetical protein